MKAAWLVVALSLVACDHDDHAHGHDHGHGHGHGDDHGAEEAEPLSCTTWADGYELFVELTPPEPGKPVSYHAHVTRLEGFQPVTEGRFVVRFLQGKKAAATAQIDGVARPGIFTPEAKAPPAGSYQLRMRYSHGDQKASFDCGKVTVKSPAAAPPEGEDGITLLKEQQWQIPFGTTWSEHRELAREVEVPAVVEPAGSEQLSIGAPTGGRFFFNPKLSLAPGQQIEKGDVLGFVAPTVAGDDYSRLRFAVDDAKLAASQTQREIERVKPLVDEGLLPDKRLVELRNQLAQEQAKLKAARRRIGSVTAPGGAGGVPIKSALDGIVAEVLVPNGEPVEPGATLVRLRGAAGAWIRARFVARPPAELAGAEPAAVRLPGGDRQVLAKAKFLSPQPVVDPKTRLATWVVEVPPGGASADELRPGLSVVLVVRVGQPERVVAVPASAVVEIDTRPYVFEQLGGESFARRRVATGRRDGGFVEIASGLGAGKRIVDLGGFDVHLASLMGSVASHRH